MVNIGNKWDEVLAGEFEKEYYLKLRQFLIEEYKTRTIYPGMHDMFNALRYTSYEDVKAVILGQDPYHGPGQAHGMSFFCAKRSETAAVTGEYLQRNEGRSGYRPAGSRLSGQMGGAGCFAAQYLSDGEGTPGQLTKGKGWEIFTDRVIELLNEREKPIVFILWGANAKSKSTIDHREAAFDSRRRPSEPFLCL